MADSQIAKQLRLKILFASVCPSTLQQASHHLGFKLHISPRATNGVAPPYMFAGQLTQVCGADTGIYIRKEHWSFSREAIAGSQAWSVADCYSLVP